MRYYYLADFLFKLLYIKREDGVTPQQLAHYYIKFCPARYYVGVKPTLKEVGHVVRRYSEWFYSRHYTKKGIRYTLYFPKKKVDYS